LEDKKGNVTGEEITKAKEKINNVTDTDKKTALEGRLDQVKEAKKAKEKEDKAQGEAQKALDKLTGDGITDENIKKAQEEINKVTDPDKKQELQEKLNQIIAEKAVKELEDKKGNVTGEEITKAEEKINNVTDTGKKTELEGRLNDVKQAKENLDKLNEAKTEAE
ncbi:hypothetical protein HMPREF3189_01388, partial [Clostridiales bacterium KA00134]